MHIKLTMKCRNSKSKYFTIYWVDSKQREEREKKGDVEEYVVWTICAVETMSTQKNIRDAFRIKTKADDYPLKWYSFELPWFHAFIEYGFYLVFCIVTMSRTMDFQNGLDFNVKKKEEQGEIYLYFAFQ